jgi:hypothetical protein
MDCRKLGRFPEGWSPELDDVKNLSNYAIIFHKVKRIFHFFFPIFKRMTTKKQS